VGQILQPGGILKLQLERTMAEHHILSLGAGVQSTALYLMFMRGEITPQIGCAIFADTQDEPAAVYRHLQWLRSLGGPEILVRTAGRLGDDLKSGRRVQGSGKARFTSIPSFTTADGGKTVGRTKRQCSKEYKTGVIERTIRREVMELGYRQRFPVKTAHVHQYLGISMDEAGRSVRIAKNFRENLKWSTPHFPLIEKGWTRADCLTWLASKVPHQTPRSSCVFCPNHKDAEWVMLREADPGGWRRAVEIDRALREPGVVVNRDMSQAMFLHRSCQPLDEVAFNTCPTPRELQMGTGFSHMCEGSCGV
jgi:hypothetical protein